MTKPKVDVLAVKRLVQEIGFSVLPPDHAEYRNWEVTVKATVGFYPGIKYKVTWGGKVWNVRQGRWDFDARPDDADFQTWILSHRFKSQHVAEARAAILATRLQTGWLTVQMVATGKYPEGR